MTRAVLRRSNFVRRSFVARRQARASAGEPRGETSKLDCPPARGERPFARFTASLFPLTSSDIPNRASCCVGSSIRRRVSGDAPRARPGRRRAAGVAGSPSRRDASSSEAGVPGSSSELLLLLSAEDSARYFFGVSGRPRLLNRVDAPSTAASAAGVSWLFAIAVRARAAARAEPPLPLRHQRSLAIQHLRADDAAVCYVTSKHVRGHRAARPNPASVAANAPHSRWL